MRSALQRSLALALFAVLCTSASSWVLSYQYADDDTGEAVRIARACLQLGQCTTKGTHASALGLFHGALWIRLISHFLRSGGGLTALQLALLALLMASAAVLFLVIRRYVSRRAATLALLLYLQPVVATSRFVELSNTTLLPLTLALYYAAAAFCVEYGSAVAGAAAAVCLAAAMSAHISCVLMLPFHLGLVALCARRPFVAVVAAGLSFAVTYTLESTDAARAVFGLVADLSAGLGLLVGAIVAVLLGVRPLRRGFAAFCAALVRKARQLRGRFASVPVRLRLRALMKAAIVYVNSAVWIGAALARSSFPDSHYLVPLVFPLVLLAVDSAEELSPRVRIALWAMGCLAVVSFPFAPVGSELGNVCCLALSALVWLATLAWVIRWRSLLPKLLGRHPFAAAPAGLAFALAVLTMAASVPDLLIVPRERETWPVAATEQLAHGLYKSGFTFPQLWGALQRQSPGTVEYTMAVLDPNLFGPPGFAVDAGWSLLALMVEPAVVARTEGVVLTFPISTTRSAIVVQAPSYLDRTRLTTCSSLVCSDPRVPATCTERQPGRPLRHLPPYFEVDGAQRPVLGTKVGFDLAREKYCILFSIPVHTSGTHVPHIVRVSEQWPLHIHIKRVSGVDFEGPLPGAEVQLIDNRAATGALEVEVSSDGFGPLSNWLEDPPLIEVTVANEHLLEPFRNGRSSLR